MLVLLFLVFLEIFINTKLQKLFKSNKIFYKIIKCIPFAKIENVGALYMYNALVSYFLVIFKTLILKIKIKFFI